MGRDRRRRGDMATRREEEPSGPAIRLPELNLPPLQNGPAQRALLFLRDMLWYLLNRTPALKIGALTLFFLIAFYVITTLFSGNIGPNVWALNVSLGGRNPADAEAALLSAWENDMTIDVIMEGQPMASLKPSQLGLELQTASMIEQARGAGLSGLPFSVNIEPIIEVNQGITQNLLLSYIDTIFIPPYEAGFTWEEGQLVGVMGRPSRELDLSTSLQVLTQNPNGILASGRFDLVIQYTPPSVMDPSPYLADAASFLERGFTLTGYDPFTNEFQPWTTTTEEMTRWLSVGPNGLSLRPATFRQFVDALNDRLRSDTLPRYLDIQEVTQTVVTAIAGGTEETLLRVRYLPRDYTIERGDTGFSIARKSGLPFQLLEAANPGLEWGSLSVSQVINLPSRDVMLSEEVISTRRIVVDLDRLWLVAYEDNEMVFNWPVSSGRTDAPTSPGIFQILSKTDKAYGSTFDLCNSSGGCGQWEMSYFMGIYEVAPGLMNGFHGAVLLPNGAYLAGGGVRGRTTYGCVMSENSNASILYEWAEVGTIVEIISSEFAPESDLGRQAQSWINQNAI